MSGSPEELLRSTLEKIVFFECKVSSLESELEAARTAAVRAREEASGARRRETSLEQALAQARGELAAATAQSAELAERVRLLEAERERFLSGMVEQARVVGAPAGDGEAAGEAHDLAGFIAELRAENARLAAWKSAAEAAGVRVDGDAPARAAAPAAAAAVPELATRFEEAGRIAVRREETRALTAFATRSERVLYEASLDDLGAQDPGVRKRAADGLRALGARAAAPLVAAAIGRERDPEVKVALLAALGALGEPGAADLALRELDDARPAVRAAALDAASALAGEAAVARLAAAQGDASALVRRRAVVLLGFTKGDQADEALAAALADRDAGVARAAAVALAGRPSARAQGALARALDHREDGVRRAAARAVGRWAGEAVDAGAPEAERRRAARRIAEKLLAVDGAALRAAVSQVPATAPRAPALAPAPRPAARPAAPAVAAAPAGEPARPARVAVAEAVAAAADPALAAAALAEVRAALRGCTIEDLAAALDRERPAVETTLRALVAQGQLVARGPRFFMS